VLHHVTVAVADLDRSASFYDSLLSPLGWRRHHDSDGTIAWGIAKPVFYIVAEGDPEPGFGMISFSALGIAAVKAAFEEGVESGGTGVAEPGARRGPGSGSFSAFLTDPDGYQIEITVSAD